MEIEDMDPKFSISINPMEDEEKSIVQFKKWKSKIKRYEEKKEIFDENIEKFYALIWEQYYSKIKEELKELDKYK